MKFSKPLLVVSSTVLIATLTACGNKEVDTAHLVPDPTSTIGRPINTESAQPSSEPETSASPSPSKFVPKDRNKTAVPSSDPAYTPKKVTVLDELWHTDLDSSIIRAIYSRNLTMIEIASIVEKSTPVADVKSIAVKQQSLAKSQNAQLKGYLEKNNIEVPKLTDRLPFVAAGADLNVNPRYIDSLKNSRAKIVEAKYFEILQNTFADFRKVADDIKGDLKESSSKSALSQARDSDNKIVDMFTKYLKDSRQTRTQP